VGDPRDTRYQSFIHTVGGKTFAVWEITEWSGAVMSTRRELIDVQTSEVVRQWVPQPYCSLPSYDFSGVDAELRVRHTPSTYQSPMVGVSYSAAASNTVYIQNSASWNNFHTAVATPPPPPAQETDDDMLRDQFTFPYTGTQIADALDAKAAAKKADIAKLESIDLDALKLLSSANAEDVTSRIKTAQRVIDELQTEAAPYRQAAGQTFELDLEDVRHFGLDKLAVQPVKTRKPRVKRTETAA
jgi:hypothetical protein